MFAHRRAILACLVLGAAACGARTGLLVPASGDGGLETPPAPAPPPPVRVTVPPPNAMSGCDAGATLIYVVTQQNTLMTFDPPTAMFETIGTLSCPAANNATPFSMAVDRSGNAFVVYSDGELFRVNLANSVCRPTGFVPQPGFSPTFGMGYSTNPADGGEVLYVASDEDAGSRLGSLDTRTFAIDVIGPFIPPIISAELTGTGGGDLFAFYATDTGSAIAQVDKVTASVTQQSALPGVFQSGSMSGAWAFAVWGGDFYTFTAPNSLRSAVTRFRPSDGSIVQVGQAPPGQAIVGAGVSTCAPQQ